jgi:predicted transcriptional regulator
MDKYMKVLTKAEEQIMQVLWKIEKGFISDIINALPLPHPAYTTVATMIRILEKKQFVAHHTYGKNHEYYPLVEKEHYTGRFIRNFTKNYFDNSFSGLVSFFAQYHQLSLNELEEIKDMIEKEIDKNKP